MKQKIIQKAIELFNERGFFDVRIRDISDALNTSTGSISYHYGNKEELMSSIYRFMLKTLDEMSIGDRLFFEKGQEIKVARFYLDYMVNFRFFFQDTLDIIRAYPKIGEMHQYQVVQEINILRNLVYRAVGLGIFVPEPQPGHYNNLVEVIWQTNHFWFARQAVKGETSLDLEKAVLMINSLLYPYYTPKGQKNYERIEAMFTMK